MKVVQDIYLTHYQAVNGTDARKQPPVFGQIQI